MDGRSILLSLIPVGLTLINYAIIRDLLWGILLGSKSQKSAEKIRKEAEGWPKFSQRYIEPHLTKFQKDYKNWMTLKLITALAAILQIAAFILLIFVFKIPFWVVAIICGVIVVLNVVLFAVMMNQTASSTNKESTKGSPWKYEHAGGEKKTPKAQKNTKKKK